MRIISVFGTEGLPIIKNPAHKVTTTDKASGAFDGWLAG